MDIGTHTARLLVAEEAAPPDLIRPLARKRTYIRLTEGQETPERRVISEGAIERTITALQGFLGAIREYHAGEVCAVGTGIIREAENRQAFVERIRRETGLEVRTVTGEEEAILTGQGVLYGLGRPEGPFVIFDLGGGSTEFLFGDRGSTIARSVPLGAAVLTKAFLSSEPAQADEIASLARHIDGLIRKACPRKEGAASAPVVVGTGGTAVTLAVMVHGLSAVALDPEKINGLEVDRSALTSLFERMRSMRLEDRLLLPGLDPGRADVIVAGTLVILRIMEYFDTSRLIVSMSDLLEGILISVLEGAKNGGKWHSLRIYL